MQSKKTLTTMFADVAWKFLIGEVVVRWMKVGLKAVDCVERAKFLRREELMLAGAGLFWKGTNQ